MSFDVLQDKIKAKKNPTVAGLDARVEYVPPFILKKHTEALGETLEAAAQAVLEFDCGLIDALADVVPAVKPQSAYFEMLGWRGMRALEARTCSSSPTSSGEISAPLPRPTARRGWAPPRWAGRPAPSLTPTASPSTAIWAPTPSNPS